MGEPAINSHLSRSTSRTGLEAFAANLGDSDLQARASELRALVESGDNLGPTPEQTLALNIQRKWKTVYGTNIASWPTELQDAFETVRAGIGFASFNNNVISALQNLSIREETYPAFEVGLTVVAELTLPDLVKQSLQLQVNANSGIIPGGSARAGLRFISSPATLVIPMWSAGLFGRATVGGVSAFGRFLGLANESAAALSVAMSVSVEAVAFMGTSDVVAKLALPNSGRASSATTLSEFTASTIFFSGLKLFGWAGTLAQSILPATELGAALAKLTGHTTSVVGLASMDRVQAAAGIAPANSANFYEALWRAGFLHATVQTTNSVVNVSGVESNWTELARKAEELNGQIVGSWPMPVLANSARQSTIALPVVTQRAIQEAMGKRGGDMPNVFLTEGKLQQAEESNIRINQKRFFDRADALSKFGATPDGGVHRPAFSEAHFLARQWFLEEAARAGLETKVDGAGNHSAVLQGETCSGRTMLIGSHLDSVPYGGRFDGALGIISALEVLQRVRELKIPLRFKLEAIDFTDEEGRFIDIFGSQAVAGTIKAEHIKSASANPIFREALFKAGLSEDSIFSARRDPSTMAGYVELHIEQGPRLIEQNVNIGVVTSIVGIRTYKVKFIGRSDHAGTTPMGKRLDAAQGASSFTLAARQLVTENFSNSVATVGNMVFEPGASNVVPQTATLLLEFRAGSEKELNNLGEVLLKQASVEAEKFGLKVETENIGFVVPAIMDAGFQGAIVGASEMLGITHTYISSGAGHDAQSMARICPAGMIFVPSQDGFSHSAREFTTPQDCTNGANVLLHTILNLNSRSE